MKLITEQSDGMRVIVEDVTQPDGTSKKKYYVEGTFMVAEKKNRNGRVYLKETLARECDRYTTEMIDTKRACGELGHPTGPNVNLDRVSHMVVSLEQNGNIFKGKAVILETPFGLIVQKLLEGGVQLGVSTRGMGSLVPKNGYQEVQSDFHLAAIDIVADPSAPGAFVQGIMEGKEWVLAGDSYREVDASKVKREINEAAARRQSEAKALEVFNRFLRRL